VKCLSQCQRATTTRTIQLNVARTMTTEISWDSWETQKKRDSEKKRKRETKTETTVLDSDANASSLRGGAPPLFHPFVHSFWWRRWQRDRAERLSCKSPSLSSFFPSFVLPHLPHPQSPLYLLFSPPLSYSVSVSLWYLISSSRKTQLKFNNENCTLAGALCCSQKLQLESMYILNCNTYANLHCKIYNKYT